MADAPQQTEAGGGAAAAEAAAPKPAGGLGSYLPLIVVVVLMPIAAWVTLMVKSKMDKSAASDGQEEAAPVETKAKGSHGAPAKTDSHGKAGKTAGWSSKQRNPELSIPLTREVVAYQPKRDDDPLKPEDVDKIVFLDAKGEPKDVAQADKIVVNVANAGGRAYAVARFSLKGPGKDLIQQININRERLLDKATGALSSHTLEEIDKPGFRNLIRAELLSEFNQILGGGSVSDVVITEFITQQ